MREDSNSQHTSKQSTLDVSRGNLLLTFSLPGQYWPDVQELPSIYLVKNKYLTKL